MYMFYFKFSIYTKFEIKHFYKQNLYSIIYILSLQKIKHTWWYILFTIIYD